MSGTTVDSGRGTTLWTVERWDAEQAAWAQKRRERYLSERILAARPEPVQRMTSAR